MRQSNKYLTHKSLTLLFHSCLLFLSWVNFSSSCSHTFLFFLFFSLSFHHNQHHQEKENNSIIFILRLDQEDNFFWNWRRRDSLRSVSISLDQETRLFIIINNNSKKNGKEENPNFANHRRKKSSGKVLSLCVHCTSFVLSSNSSRVCWSPSSPSSYMLFFLSRHLSLIHLCPWFRSLSRNASLVWWRRHTSWVSCVTVKSHSSSSTLPTNFSNMRVQTWIKSCSSTRSTMNPTRAGPIATS